MDPKEKFAKKEEKGAQPTKVEVEVETKPADTSSEDVMDAEREVTDAKITAAVGAPPKPSEPIRVSDMNAMGKALNDAVSFVTDGAVPATQIQLDTAVGATEAPIDQGTWMSVYIVSKMAEAVEHMYPGVGAPYTYDPASIGTTAGVRDITGKLQKMSRDKDFKAKVEELAKQSAEAQMSEQPPSPGPASGGTASGNLGGQTTGPV